MCAAWPVAVLNTGVENRCSTLVFGSIVCLLSFLEIHSIPCRPHTSTSDSKHLQSKDSQVYHSLDLYANQYGRSHAYSNTSSSGWWTTRSTQRSARWPSSARRCVPMSSRTYADLLFRTKRPLPCLQAPPSRALQTKMRKVQAEAPGPLHSDLQKMSPMGPSPYRLPK